jgi:hypothetical protein
MTQENQNPTLNFELTLQETNFILVGIQELPGKICNPLSEKIKAQAQAQLDAIQAEAPSQEAPAAE